MEIANSTQKEAQTKKHIFILSGQSNMAGRGGVTKHKHWDSVVPPECRPDPSVLRLNAHLHWEEAREPLHSDIDTKKVCGVGPGMSFANAVKERVGALGLVPCAVGGTALKEWARGMHLYENMVTRAKAAVKTAGDGGGEIRALLWYQGEHPQFLSQFNLSKKMASANLLPLLLILSLLYIACTAESAASTSSFIKASCRATQYPAVCVQSLSAYSSAIQQSPRQLAQTALSVSLARAESMKAFVTKLTKFKGLKAREYAAIKDCLDEVGDSVDRISRSVRELKSMGKGKGKDFLWHVSNVETWVSAALTDENTCLDGFSGRALDGRIKTSIKARVTNVAQVTSNALALINQFASKY